MSWRQLKHERFEVPLLLTLASCTCALTYVCGACQVQDPNFVEYFSGNRLLPGSETAAHCYCGHQFGQFSGQLGDGAAIYLGEVRTL